jgi:hypothetical protein
MNRASSWASRISAVELVECLGLGPPRQPRGGVDLDVVDAIMMALYELGHELSMDGRGGAPSHGNGWRRVSAQLPAFGEFPNLQDA